MVEPRTTGAAGPGGTTGTDGANGADGAGVGGITGAARIAGQPGRASCRRSTCSGGCAPPCWSRTACCPRSRTWAGPTRTPTAAIAIGGHGGELLRGGYAKIIPGSAARRAAGSAELLRRLTLRRVPLLRGRGRAAYVASLAPWAAAVAAHPQATLDDFYLVNRAGRWSAAARQAYAIRSVMAQPFFDDGVVRAARSAPLAERLDDRLVRGAIGALCPALLGHPARRRPVEVRRRSPPDWRRSDRRDWGRG